MVPSAIYFFNLFLLSCKRVSKTVGLLRKFQNVLPRTSKLFIRSHFDHGDIIRGQAYNFDFHQKLEWFQYNASLAITGTIKETFKENSTWNCTLNHINCVKSVRIRSYSGPHFPAFWLNLERYEVSLCIQSECGKMGTRITPNMHTFYAVFN